MRLEPHPISR